MVKSDSVADDDAGAAPGADPEKTTRALSAENMIKSYVIASVAAGSVPVPLFDIAAVAGIQLRMIQKLSHLYGKEFSEHAARNIISALAGGVVSYGGGYVLAASAFKLIPGIGWMVGMASLPIVSGATTYAVGRVMVNHFEGGGSLFDLSADDVRAFYEEQFRKGKEVAAGLKGAASGKGGSEAA
ncbi:YcjF family protein [Roseospira navarrensis]|uniref:DUF697 domain-containing protein n=1 Tax=Roseospira navarrensis TaxID=140058 RepID=A0A7X1ZC93_9PROT|nr:DUF697 domain-containing protein [Roseospira navarrensis]MQX35697.1 DUF697 domain-containing protein [Roseospira navarrensis]